MKRCWHVLVQNAYIDVRCRHKNMRKRRKMQPKTPEYSRLHFIRLMQCIHEKFSIQIEWNECWICICVKSDDGHAAKCLVCISSNHEIDEIVTFDYRIEMLLLVELIHRMYCSLQVLLFNHIDSMKSPNQNWPLTE